jgi:ATP-dependent helicase/nuclease subunit A
VPFTCNAEQLERCGIPAETSGSSALHEEVRALSLLAQCLNDAADQAALLAVLRGLLFGLSDTALTQFKREGHLFSYLAPPEEERCSERSLPAARALHTLRKYWEWTKSLPALPRLCESLKTPG